MKKKILASAMALAMVLSLTPVTALAAEDVEATQPVVEETTTIPVENESQLGDLSITTANGTVTGETVNGSYIFTAPGDSAITDYTVTATLGDGAELTATTPNDNELYVASVDGTTAQLKFRVEINDEYLSDSDMFTLTLTSADGGATWTGGFNQAGLLTLDALADSISNFDVSLAAGALGAGSAARDLLVNMDDVNVMLILCAPDATVYTVTYVVGNDTIEWKLPAGMDMPTPQVDLADGESIAWYTDSGHQNSLGEDAVVEANTTIYAEITSTDPDPDPDPDPNPDPTPDDFLTALTGGADVTIDSMEDWNLFVQNSASTQAGQVVTLGTSIDCQNASYESLKFYGDFNGNNNSISNATFEATSDTPSGESCSGMFATLGHGQTVANLVLNNIEVEYAGEYAGALVGMADGWSGDEVLIQNVQVRNSGISGMAAGGVAGFIRHTTVQFCSSRDTRVTGISNGGGVVGLSNAVVKYCYSTTSPTALPSFLGGHAGGVVGKNVRGAYTEYCWATMAVVGGSGEGTEAGGTDIGAFDDVSDSTTATQFVIAGFTQDCWVRAAGTATDFNPSVIFYTFE